MTYSQYLSPEPSGCQCFPELRQAIPLLKVVQFVTSPRAEVVQLLNSCVFTILYNFTLPSGIAIYTFHFTLPGRVEGEGRTIGEGMSFLVLFAHLARSPLPASSRGSSATLPREGEFRCLTCVDSDARQEGEFINCTASEKGETSLRADASGDASNADAGNRRKKNPASPTGVRG